LSCKNKTNLINGIFADFININDRALHYGDGLFETILCNGRQLYYWQRHYQRLQDSALKLNIKCPKQKPLLDDISQLFDIQEIASGKPCVIKIILSRGNGERGYKYSSKIDTNRFVMISELPIDYSSLLSEQLLSGDLFMCKTQASINESLAGIKHLNRLENVMASNEWANTPNHQYIDGLMLNANGHIIECTMSNIFAVKNDQIVTPDLTQSGVSGIMRDEVMKLAKNNNIKLSERNITIDDFFNMDELFITNSLIGLKSINKLNDTHYKKSHITKLIFDALISTKENHVQVI
jgi:4-amino-4-deoxychorismate lyase